MTFKQYLSHLNLRSTPIFPRFSTTFKATLISLFILTSAFFISRSIAASNPIQKYNDGQAGLSLESWVPRWSEISVVNMLDMGVGTENLSPDLISGRIPRDGRFFVNPPGGIIGSTNQFIGQLYQPPISGVEYLAEMKNEFLGIKPAYAQGVGFKGLQPIIPIWKAFRNMVYIFASIVFIIIGIMIMLRVKISPQAVISIQTAIPQLVTALILVTFSYAIAGLIIDLSVFIMGMVLAILFQSQGKNLNGNLFGPSMAWFSHIPVLNNLLTPFNFANLSEASIRTTASLLFIPSMMTILLGAMISTMIGVVIAGPLVIVAPATTAVLGGIGAIIVVIILMFAIIVWLFKFLLGLFKCYATLLFKIILGPLEIGLGAFPNSKMGFGTWILDVVANISVFPISLLFLVISNMIIMEIIWGAQLSNFRAIFSGDILGGGVWTPPILGGDVTEFIFRPYGGIAAMAIGVSTLMLLSKLPDMIPQFIFMLKPSPWGTAIGEGMNPDNLPVIGTQLKSWKAAAEKNRQESMQTAQANLYNQTLEQPVRAFSNRVKRKYPKFNQRNTPQDVTPIESSSEDETGGA